MDTIFLLLDDDDEEWVTVCFEKPPSGIKKISDKSQCNYNKKCQCDVYFPKTIVGLIHMLKIKNI